jgi:hypothetical protein
MTEASEQKRKRGGQPGNKNAVGLKPLTDCLRRAVLAKDGKLARELADKLVRMAMKGNVIAWRELADRVDGKVPQAVEMSGPNGGAIQLNDADAQFDRAKRLAFVLAQGTIAKAKASADASHA